MTTIDKIKELTESAANMIESLSSIQGLNDFIGEDMIEDVLNVKDRYLELSERQYNNIKNTIKCSFQFTIKNAAKPLKTGQTEEDLYIDEIEDILTIVNETILDKITDILENQAKKLNELSEKIQALQKQIDDSDLDGTLVRRFEDLSNEMELAELGVKTGEYQMSQEETFNAYIPVETWELTKV